MSSDNAVIPGPDMIVCGNSAVDLTFSVDRYPGPNEKCSASAFNRNPGGQGVNMALVAARLGVKCALISKVGADDEGALIAAELARHGVQSDGVVREVGGRTPVVSVVVDRNQGTRACVHDKTGMTPLMLGETSMKPAADARVILVDGRFGDVCLALASEATSHGVSVVVTLERMTEQNRRLSSLADVLIMPSTLVLAQHLGTDVVNAGRAFIKDLAVPSLIATLGAEGCVVVGADGYRKLDGFPADVSDTVGAGDAFAAAVAVGLTWGWTIEAAAEFGNYIGARACEGTRDRWEHIPVRPTIDEALTLISRST
jgi:ribokinase